MNNNPDDLVTRIDGLLDGTTIEWDGLSPDAMRSRPINMVINRNRRHDEAHQVGDTVEVYELGEPQPAPPVVSWMRHTNSPCIVTPAFRPHRGVRWWIIDTFGLEPALARIADQLTAGINWLTR